MTVQPLTHGPLPETEAPSSSASKVLGVLAYMLGQGKGAVSLTEVSIAAGLPKSTTHRLLKVLEDHGFAERDGSLYRLGNTFLDLGESARLSRYAELRDAAYPQLAGLFERSGAIAVHLGVLRGRSIHYVDKLMQPEGVRLPTRVGGRFPAACTGLGKAMLAASPPDVVARLLAEPLPRATPRSVSGHGHLIAQLRQAKHDGFVVEQEEACHGVVCIAAAIMTRGEPVAAVSMAVPTVAIGRSRVGRAAELGRMVAASAQAIGEALEPSGARDVAAPGTIHSLRPEARHGHDTATTGKEQDLVR